MAAAFHCFTPGSFYELNSSPASLATTSHRCSYVTFIQVAIISMMTTLLQRAVLSRGYTAYDAALLIDCITQPAL